MSPAPVRLRVLPREVPGADSNGLRRQPRPGDRSARTWPRRSWRCCPAARRVRPRDGGDRRAALHPGDIAVLVRTNPQAQLVQSRPARRPGSRSSCPAGPACSPRPPPLSGSCCWRRSSSRTAPPGSAGWRWAASSGWTPLRWTRAATRSPTSSALRLRDLGDRCSSERGVAALFEAVSLSEQVQPRVLGPDRRRAAAHRPAPHRAGAARGRAGGPARPDRAAALAAPPPRGGQARGRPGAQPPAGDRRRRGAGHHRAHQQGPGVPGRAGAVRVEPLGAQQPPVTAVFHDEDGRRIRDVGGAGSPDWSSTMSGAAAGGGRRRAAPGLRRPHPGAVAPVAVVGADVPTRPQSRCTGCCCTTTRGRRADGRSRCPDDDAALDAFRARAPRAAATSSWRRVDPERPRPRGLRDRPPATAGSASRPSAARSTAGWRRTSYSALTPAAHEQVAAVRQRAGGGAEGRRDRRRGSRDTRRPSD